MPAISTMSNLVCSIVCQESNFLCTGWACHFLLPGPDTRKTILKRYINSEKISSFYEEILEKDRTKKINIQLHDECCIVWPLLAGEMVHADQNSACESRNKIIAKLQGVLPNSYVISSSGCTSNDLMYFNTAGCRVFGMRYAEKLLSLPAYEKIKKTDTQPVAP